MDGSSEKRNRIERSMVPLGLRNDESTHRMAQSNKSSWSEQIHRMSHELRERSVFDSSNHAWIQHVGIIRH